MSQRATPQPLPLAGSAYSEQNEQVTRRQIEQSLQDLTVDLDNVRNLRDRDVVLSVTRKSFLFMGASNG